MASTGLPLQSTWIRWRSKKAKLQDLGRITYWSSMLR